MTRICNCSVATFYFTSWAALIRHKHGFIFTVKMKLNVTYRKMGAKNRD